MTVIYAVLAVVLVVVLVQTVLLLLLYRQVGSVLLARSSEAAESGPAIGSVLTEDMWSAVGLDREDMKERTLILLTQRGCGACAMALRGLPDWLNRRDGRLSVIAAGDGVVDLDEGARRQLVSAGVIEHGGTAAISILGVKGTPFALVIDRGGQVLSKGILSTEVQLIQLESSAA